MSDRFAKFYQPEDKLDFRALMNDWSAECITLQNPATRRITTISGDGDQVETSPESLEVTVSSRLPVIVQLWLSDDTDITCGIRFIGDRRVVEEYGLDGLCQDEIDRVLRVIVARFKMKAVEVPSLFLVADREGYTIVMNWDRLSVTGRYEEQVCPDVLGIPLERLLDFEKCSDYRAVRFGEYLILARNAMA